MRGMRASLVLLLVVPQPGRTETACLKYGPCPLDLSAFVCTTTLGSSFVRQVCYDPPKRFVAIKLNETWYPYCEVDPASVQALTSAASVGTHFNQHFRSAPGGTRGPFDCRDHPMPAYGP